VTHEISPYRFGPMLATNETSASGPTRAGWLRRAWWAVRRSRFGANVEVAFRIDGTLGHVKKIELTITWKRPDSNGRILSYEIDCTPTELYALEAWCAAYPARLPMAVYHRGPSSEAFTVLPPFVVPLFTRTVATVAAIVARQARPEAPHV